MKKMLPIFIISLGIDQIVKIIVKSKMAFATSINVIKNFFRITYLKNTGAAFSILSENRILLILITFVGLGLLYLFFIKNKKIEKHEGYCYGLLLGGIIGNLIDRISYGYVIDYLDFNFGSYNYPVFNFADICIVVSITLLVIFSFKEVKHED